MIDLSFFYFIPMVWEIL